MTTRWENVPVVMPMWHGNMKPFRSEQQPHPGVRELAILEKAISEGRLIVERLVPPLDPDVDMRDAALDDMRQQLAEARTDRDRAEARCAELELRMQQIREVAK